VLLNFLTELSGFAHVFMQSQDKFSFQPDWKPWFTAI